MEGMNLRSNQPKARPQIDLTGLAMWVDCAKGMMYNGVYPCTQYGVKVGDTSNCFVTDPWGDPQGAYRGIGGVGKYYIPVDSRFDTPSDFSIAFWMLDIATSNGTVYMFGLTNESTVRPFYFSRQYDDSLGGRWGGAFYDDASQYESLGVQWYGTYPPRHQWNHFVITHDSSTNMMRWYYNGKLGLEQELITATGRVARVSGNNPSFSIGALDQGIGDSTGCPMCRVSYWHRALSQHDINVLFNGGEDLRFADIGYPNPLNNYLFATAFEEEGIPAGAKDLGTVATDFNNTSRTIIKGQSAYFITNNTIGFYFTPSEEVWAYFVMHNDGIVSFSGGMALYTTGDNGGMYMRTYSTSGAVRMYGTNTTTDNLGADYVQTTDTNFHVWLHYKTDGTVEWWASPNSTRPETKQGGGGPNAYVGRSPAYLLRFTRPGVGMWLDNVLISKNEIGSDPFANL